MVYQINRLIESEKFTKLQKFIIVIIFGSTFLAYTCVQLYSSWRFSNSILRKQYGVNTVLYTDISPPGVIVRPAHGLGNQLFRYSCSYALSRKLNVPLYLQVTPQLAKSYLEKGEDHSRDKEVANSRKRPFLLDQFPNLPLDHLITPQTKINGSSVKFDDDFLLNLDKQNLTAYSNKLLIHDDYCESETFFTPYQEDIKRIFRPDMGKLTSAGNKWRNLIEETIRNGTIPIAVHIRRGDYVSNGRKYWATPITFYLQAMEIIKQTNSVESIAFFVFSDDIKSVKKSLHEHLAEKEFSLIFVSGGSNSTSSLDDFILMTLFSHLIISNSTYSWWAAYLSSSPNKTIIAPTFHPNFFDHYTSTKQREFKRKVINTLWYPPEWTVLNPYIADTTIS